MPEDPKQTFRKARAQQQADREAEEQRKIQRRIARQRERRERQPPPEGNETEAAQWVRDNLEWTEYPGLWVPKYCSWSDYSGSMVERSNGAALLRDHPDLFEEGLGGHGTVWVGIPEDKRVSLTDEQYETLKDLVSALEDYPVIDDDLHSRMEMESQWEYWEEYGRDGIREALVKKFEGNADAQIAVLTRPNEFWDTMFNEHSFYEHMGEEEGGNWYFHEDRAAADIGEDEIVNADAVEDLKKQIFFKEHADDLEKAFRQAGVDVNSSEHLWQMVKYAEHVMGSSGVWEVKNRFHTGKGEVDPSDYLSIVSIQDIVNVLDAPEAHQKMLHRHWAEDPRQLKLPGYESKAVELATAILDGEDPKSVLRQASSGNPWGPKWVKDESGTWRAKPLSNRVYIIEPFSQGYCLTELWKGAWTGEWKEVYRKCFKTPEEVRAHFPARLREAEDPKAALRAAANPKGIPRRYVGNMPKHVYISGRRWFSRTYGNTYFTAQIYVDGQLVHEMPMEYGYGDQYFQRSFEWLEDNGYIPKRPEMQGRMGNYTEAPWRWAEQHGFKLEYQAQDVRRQRDL